MRTDNKDEEASGRSEAIISAGRRRQETFVRQINISRLSVMECLELTANQDNPDNMIIVMRWASREHYDTYRAWRESNGDVKHFADATESGLSTRFFNITGV